MFGLGSSELLIILFGILVLFGAKRLPELANSLGASVGSFKKGLKEGNEPEQSESKKLSSSSAEDAVASVRVEESADKHTA